MGPKNKKSAKSTDKSVKGKDAKNTSDTTNITKQETVKPKEKAIQQKIDFPVTTPTEPKKKVKPQQTVKPKEKAIKKTQQKLKFPATTPKTTSTTASTSFSTAVNVQDITTTHSTPPPQKRPPPESNVDSDSPYSTSSRVFQINTKVSKRDTLDGFPTENLLSGFIANTSIDQENLSSQDENATKTTVDIHRGKDGRCSTKSTKPIKNTHRRNIHDLEKISSVQDENVTKTTVDTHRGIEECSLTRTRSKRKGESSDDSRDQSKK